MASLRTLAPLAALVTSATAFTGLKTCDADLPMSCQNNTAVEDTCCFVTSGEILLTQFWDTEPVTGPADSWTIHGLWPNYCGGDYPSNCDSNREYTNITDILNEGGATETLSEMEKYWKDYEGDDESFWEHEWGKHGTCVSTLEPECYGAEFEAGQDAIQYFATTVKLFKSLPTHKWLADAGITPSTSEKYSFKDVKAALEKQHGASVSLSCDGDKLNEVWYAFNVKGSLQEGDFKAVDISGSTAIAGDCSDQISYPLKTGANATRVPSGFKPQTRPFKPLKPVNVGQN